MWRKVKSKIYNFLRWSEKYTKTDMVYLARGGFWLTSGQTISFVLTFLLSVAFANLLPRETFGFYKYVLSVVPILAISTLSGINMAVAQAVARGYEGSLIPALKSKIRWGLLGALASLILAGYYYFQNNTILTISFLIAAVFLPFKDSFAIYGTLLQGRKLFNIITKYSVISQIVAIGVLIITLFITKNFLLILLIYFASWTFLHFLFLKITFKKFPPNQNQDPKTTSYGKHLSLINVIGILASYLDRLLIFHYLGPVNLAVYSFALAPVEQIKGLFKNIPTLALPKISPRSFKEINLMLYKRLFQLFLIGGFITLIYLLFAPYLFKILFPKYLDSVSFSQIFSITIALRLPVIFLSTVGQSKITFIPKEILYPAALLPQFVLIGLLFFLVKPYGIMGVIVSRILFLILAIIISLIYWRKLVKMNIK